MVTEKFVKELVDAGVIGGGGFEYEVIETTTDTNGMCNVDNSVLLFNKGLVISAVAIQDNTEYRYNEGNLVIKPQSFKTPVGEKPRYSFSAFYNSNSNPLAVTTTKLTYSAVKFVVVYIPWDKIDLNGV